MRIARVPTAVASHLATFVLGLVVAGGTIVHALPATQSADARYASLDAFAQSLALIASEHVDVVSERELLYGAIEGMVSRLDAHSAFYTPSQYTRLRQDTEGAFGGVGLTLGEGVGDPSYPLVELVIPGSPAARAGLQLGDAIIAVDGVMTDKKNSKEKVSAVAWHSRLRGAEGTRVSLRVIRKAWKMPRTLTLVRERIAIPSVQSERFGNVVHLSIRRFREATSRDVYRALSAELTTPNTRLILDLRGNPGGLLDKGIEVADSFLDHGVIVSVVSRGGRDVEVSRAHRDHSYSKVPMVVLVDQNTASASEIVTAALHDNGRATVIGVPTYGKGSVQSFLDLTDGSGLKLTTSRYLTPKGVTVEGAGIKPDHVVEAFAADIVRPTGAEDVPTAKQLKLIELPGLNKAQREQMRDDPQLREAYQQLVR